MDKVVQLEVVEDTESYVTNYEVRRGKQCDTGRTVSWERYWKGLTYPRG